MKVIPFETVSCLEPEDIPGFFRVHFITELDVPDKAFVGASVLYMGKDVGHTKHSHDSTTEVAYILAGQALQSFWDSDDREKPQTMSAGDLALISPGVVHQTLGLSSDEEPLAMYIFTARTAPKCFRAELSADRELVLDCDCESIVFVASGTATIDTKQEQLSLTPLTHVELQAGDCIRLRAAKNGQTQCLIFTLSDTAPAGAEALTFITGEDEL